MVIIYIRYSSDYLSSTKSYDSGEVTDKEYNPIEFVTISLLSANDSSLIAGTITNEKGKFTLHVKKKRITLSAHLI